MSRASLLGLLLLTALLAACAAEPAPTAPPTPSPPTAAPTPEPPSPQALPPVQDATGLKAEGLVAADDLRLPDAADDGTARLQAGERTYLLAPARRVAPGGRPGLLLVLPAANTTLRTEYDRYGLDALRRTDGDAEQVAVLGHSVGALMAWRLACTPGFGAAVVVAVSGTLMSDCGPLTPTPAFLGLNGAADTTVPFPGSRRVVPILGVAPPSVPSSLERLATAGGCGPAVTANKGASTVVRHQDCTGGSTVALQVVAGTGHPWAGLDATRRSAAFLAEHLAGVR